MSEQQLAFQNQHIQLTVDKKPGCKVTMNIETNALATEAAKRAAIKNIAKEVNIPGFRKGKAPEALVTQKFPSQVEREFREILIRNSFNEAIQLSNFRPYSQNAPMKLVKCEPLNQNSYLVILEFEAYPEVPKVEVTSLQSPNVETSSISDADVEQKIEELRTHHAEWIDVQKAAERDDFVILDIDLIEHAEPESVRKDTRFQLSEGKIPSWALNLALGLKEGESKEGFSEPEADQDAADFHPRKCRITLKKIQQAKLPAVDDALAKKAGVTNIEDLRKSIVKSLEKNAEMRAQQQRRATMQKALIASYQFDLPAERLKQIREECLEIAEYEKKDNQEEKKAYADQLTSNAEENLRLSYLLPGVIRDNKISVPSLEEVRQRATEHLIMHYMSGQKEKLQESEIQQVYQIAESELLKERALDFLINHVKKS